MLFSGDEVNKPVNVLSGGEKVRVMLSKLMLLKSNVLILDDPTNHLDLESISSLNDGLKTLKNLLFFASHDHEFIQTLANHIIVLSKNGVIDRIDETYDEFLENQEVQEKSRTFGKIKPFSTVGADKRFSSLIFSILLFIITYEKIKNFLNLIIYLHFLSHFYPVFNLFYKWNLLEK